MKQLFYVSLVFVLLITVSCRRNRAERQYERYLNDSDRVEFVTPPEDTVEIEVEEVKSTVAPDDGEGVFSIPDIPEQRDVNMRSNDADVKEFMKGKDVDHSR